MFPRALKVHLKFKSIFPGCISSSCSSYQTAARVPRSNRQASFTTLSCLKATAPKPRNNVPPVRKPSVHQSPSSPDTRPTTLAPSASEIRDKRLSLLARKTIQSGNTVLFQSLSHTGYMFAAWIGGAVCLGGAFLILNLGLYEDNKELPWFVPVAYRISGIFLVAVGSWSIVRSSRLVSSIAILRRHDKAQLLFKIRRNIPVPFIKPKEIIVDASNVVFQRRMVMPLGRAPPDPRSSINIGSRISGLPHRFFAGTRQFIFSDGIVSVSIVGQGGVWKLDSNGWFLDNGNRFASDGRRYGEPNWASRPVESVIPSGTGLFGGFGPVNNTVFPKYTDQSYEEWKFQGLVQAGIIRPAEQSRPWAFENHLVVLQGSTSMIEVVVGGNNPKPWLIHEILLVTGSTFFKAAVNSPFREGHERKVMLTADDNLVFQLFVQFLYTKNFLASSLELLLKAYVLGDKLGAPSFKANVLEKIFNLNLSHCYFSAKQVLWVFENSLPNSGLRRLTSDSVARATLRQRLTYGKEDWEMLAPVMPELMEGVISVAGAQIARIDWLQMPGMGSYRD